MFEGSRIESVVLPSTLKRIEYHAFSYCKNLKSINLPKDLEYLGDWCFCGSELAEAQIPRTGIKVGCCTFEGCPLENSLVFRDGKVFPKDQ